ncbi:MAG: efflux RND transporter periplasmic adaptor subunit [Chitinophagaceae bacterium]|nr:efflux RND transporter periplasmic adaptor subunit [Chitinophagaceae bacterium]
MKFFKITILVFLFSCGAKTETEQPVQETAEQKTTLNDAQIKSAGLLTDTIRMETLHTEILVNGVVDVPPQNMISVSFPLGGYLRTTDLLPGMHVNRGQVIARIEDPSLVQLQQDYLVAKAKLTYLELDFERQRELNADEVNTAKQFQQVQADFVAQKVTIRALGEKLRLVNIDPEKLNENTISRSVPIYSPINGFVSKVNVNIGKYVNPADVLFELINPDDMHAALTVFEKDLPFVQPRQRVKVSFVEDPLKEYECEVLLVTKNVDENRGALVHCHFETQPKQLLPGMFLNARIQVDNVKTLAVPEEALVRYANNEYLIKVTGKNTYELLPVVSGVKQEGKVAVSSTKENLTDVVVVTKGAYTVLSAMMNKGEE